MTEQQMLNELERGRKLSQQEDYRIAWAMTNGTVVAVALDSTTVKALKGIGYWVCSIFEDGHRVEA